MLGTPISHTRSTAPTTRWALALIAGSSLCACSAGGADAETPSNLLLVTFDTTRADRLGCYGYERGATPNVDRLAERGVLFEACISVAPITLPTHTSIMTGLYPFHHGARNNGTHHVPADVTTLAELLSQEGFETGATVSAFVLDSRFGLDQGFQHYDDDLAGAVGTVTGIVRETPADDTARRAARWLSERGDERWFMWVHFFDPHTPYEPPEPYASTFANEPYDAEIAHVDARLGELLGLLERDGELDETLVVVTADHGESLHEHGEVIHGIFVYDATTRVPWIMAHPGLAAGLRVEEVVSAVDMAPTLLELLGLPPPTECDGESLAASARGLEPASADRYVYAEAMMPWYNRGWSDLRSIRDANGRYVRGPRPEFYDLRVDPGETRDIHADAGKRLEPYLARLESMLADGERDARSIGPGGMDASTRDALAALGYAWDEGAAESTPEARLDPKDALELWEQAARAAALMRAGEYEESEKLFREVVRAVPGDVNSHMILAALLTRAGRDAEAHELLVHAAELPGALSGTIVQLAEAERLLGMTAWPTTLERAKVLFPRDPLPWLRQGEWAQENGDLDAAERSFSRAVELDEGYARAWVGLGSVAVARGRFREAEEALRRATAADPLLPEAWAELGDALRGTGRVREALECYARAHELYPESVTTLLQLGLAQAATGDRAGAEESFRAMLALDDTSFAANFNLGIHCLREKRVEEAVRYFEQACVLEPERAEAWHHRLLTLGMLGRHADVIAVAEGLIEFEPNDLTPRIAAARSCLALGREREAREHLQAALSMDRARTQGMARRDPVLARLLATLAETDADR